MKHPETILITGASSGLGKALALHYATPGKRLLLLGRDRDRLREVEIACREKRAAVVTAPIDITDAGRMRQFIEEQFRTHAIDLAFANAGVSGGTGGGGESAEQVRRIFAVNVDGVLNTLLPLVPLMTGRGRGQIAIISSLAAMRGLPSATAYSASKAAVKHYGEALRGQLRKTGVKVNVVCPGYIKTPLTDVNQFPMPFLMSAEQAATRISKGLQRNQARIAFPKRLYIPLWFASLLSPSLTDWFFAALPAKRTEG